MTGRRATTLLFAALAVSSVTGIGGIGLGVIGVSEAVCFGAGGALALAMLAGASEHHADGLHPARMQLARFRRSGEPADLLVVQAPAKVSMAGGRPSRNCASAVSSVLRVTDGVSIIPSLSGNGLCAVLESDERTRSAIDRRLRRACGNEIQLAWASSPDDGVTLDSLLAVALDRLPRSESGRQGRHRLGPLPARFLPRGVGNERGPMRSAH